MSKKLICSFSFVLVLVLVGSASAALVGHWQLDDGSGTTAVDSSGNGNNGTLQGSPQWVAGFAAGGLELNGTTDYVDCGSGSSLDITEQITIAAWVKIDVFGDWDGIVTKGITQAPYAMQMWGDGSLRFSANWGTPAGGVGDGSWNTNTKMAAGEWLHVVVTYDGSTLRFYFDGEKDSLEVAQGLTFGTAAESLVLGCDFPGGDEYFDGVMDDVRIYNQALTEAEIRQLAFRPKAYDPNPPDGAAGVTVPLLTWKVGTTAKWHDIYFGTNPTPGAAEYKGPPSAWNVYYHQQPFIPNTTYYWRIDEVEADGTTIYTGDVWSFMAAPLLAYDPDPPDGARYVPADADLNWTPGSTAVTHDVYFGTDEPDVTNGTGDTFKVNQQDPTYDPGTLAKDTTYYWRIDEVESNLTTKHRGEVWSFKTLPYIPISDPNFVAWWKLDEGQGTTALDWSGHDNHGTLRGDPQAVAGYDGDALDFDGVDDYVVSSSTNVPAGPSSFTITAWIFPNEHNDDIITWWGQSGVEHRANGFRLMAGGQIRHYFWSNDYDITTGDLSGQWSHLALAHDGAGNRRFYLNGQQVIGSYIGATQAPDVPATNVYIGARAPDNTEYFNGVIDDVRIYDIALTAAQIPETMRGDPLLAWNAKPANGSTPDIEGASPLSWSPGDKAAKHDVYLGTDEDAVTDADTTTTGVYRGRQDPNSYTPPQALEFGQSYHWRIDEYNTDATISEGRVWSFTVADYLIVDDFESYDDYCNRIFYVWPDGWGHNGDVSCGVAAYGGNGTGSTVGYLREPYAEQTIVNGGRQAMPMEYLNDGSTGKALYSETERTFGPPQDWTRQDVKALALWFRGVPASVGSFSYDAVTGIYTMTAAGADIWDVPDFPGAGAGSFHDEFHYGYKRLSGVGTIVAQVLSVGNTNASAKAGVMIRETLDANSVHAMVVMTPGNGVLFEGRTVTGGLSFSTSLTGITAPRWVRLTRSGNTFTGEHSTDGSTWETIGTQDIPMAADVYVGLALTSHNVNATCVAEFSDVTITGTVTGQWQSQDIGIASNIAEQLYVAVQDSAGKSKVVNHPDPDAVLSDTYQEWNIDLKEVSDAGVNLNSIKKMYIGVGDRNAPKLGGTGMLYIDDIRLYQPRCFPDIIKPAGDFNNNCVVDYPDVEIMASDWLVEDQVIATTDPGSASLVGYWKLDDGSGTAAVDSSVNNNNGILHGGPQWVTGYDGDALEFDGGNDYVELPIGSVINSLTSSTFATWVNFSNAGGAWQRIFDFGNDTTAYMFLTPRLGTTGPMRFGITTGGGGSPEQMATAQTTLASGWHHVAVTIDADGDTITLYLDVVVVAQNTEATLSPSDLGVTTNNWLGRSQYAGDAFYRGLIDDFRIYSRALTQAEIAYMADGTPGDGQFHVPVPSPAELYEAETEGSRTVNFMDFAVLAGSWLDELLWP